MYSSASPSELAAMHGRPTTQTSRRRVRRTTTKSSPQGGLVGTERIPKGGIKIKPTARKSGMLASRPIGSDYASDALRSTIPVPLAHAERSAENITAIEPESHDIIPLIQYMKHRGLSTNNHISSTSLPVPAFSSDIKTPEEVTGAGMEDPGATILSTTDNPVTKPALQPDTWSDAVLKINKAEESLHDLNLFCKTLSQEIKNTKMTLEESQKAIHVTTKHDESAYPTSWGVRIKTKRI